MGARFRSWWQKIKNHRMWSAVIIVASALVIALVVAVVLGYWLNWPWVGVSGGNSKITTITTTTEQPPAKTLWDWMQLLFIPVVLAVAGFWFNHRERKSAERRAEAEKEIEQQRAKAEQDIASDNQRETALQAYINEMSELILHGNLRRGVEENEVRVIASVRTLTVLRRLDAERKGSVLRFLHDSGLIDKDKSIIDLSGAELSGADLMKANLSRANLSRANLSGAVLNWADLHYTDLRGANLSEAHMSWVDLCGANLSGANLSGTNLRMALYTGPDLVPPVLENAQLRGANLRGADLEGANLGGADLEEADLRRANLRRADLRRANLKVTDLRDAKLEGADLTNVIGITAEELEKQAKPLKGATMPDGSIHP